MYIYILQRRNTENKWEDSALIPTSVMGAALHLCINV